MGRGEARIGVFASVVVIAVGAFLLWIGGLDATTIGVILIALGAIGTLLSLMFRSHSSRYRGHDYDDDEERLTILPR